jgi:hypothetical protein
LSGHINAIGAIVSHETSASRTGGHDTFSRRSPPESFGESNPPCFRHSVENRKSDYIALLAKVQAEILLFILYCSIAFQSTRVRKRVGLAPATVNYRIIYLIS